MRTILENKILRNHEVNLKTEAEDVLKRIRKIKEYRRLKMSEILLYNVLSNFE